MKKKLLKMSFHETNKQKNNVQDVGIQDPGAFGVCLWSRRPKFMITVQNGRGNEFLQTSKEGGESPSLKIPLYIGVLMNRVTLTDLEELD